MPRESKRSDESSIARQATFEREALRAYTSLSYLETHLDKVFDDGFALRGITIKPPDYERHEWFAVVRCTIDGVHMVGFHASATYRELCMGIVDRLVNQSMKWKEDEYA